jgi:hypothetical protein
MSRWTVRFALIGLTAGMVAAAGVAGLAATESNAPSADSPTYHPAASDLMTSTIQPRHIKLWLAGKAENWVFADYERHNIGGALARMATAIPAYKDVPYTDLIAAYATPQLTALDTAIKAKDEGAFVKAYGELTAGCNGCHQATGHEMVVIAVPDGNPFPDQNFKTPAN